MSSILPPGIRDQTAWSITKLQIDEWSETGANCRNQLIAVLVSIQKDLRHASSPAKAVKRTITKIERFFENKEVRGAIHEKNNRRIQFDLIFPARTEGGLGFNFLIGEVFGRSGVYKLNESPQVQINVHALQRLFERISSRSTAAALNEIYSSIRVAVTWNAAGLNSGARCWPVVSEHGFFVAVPDEKSECTTLITWIKNERLSKKWIGVLDNIRKLQRHHPELLFDTAYVEQFIRSFPWMLEEHVPGLDLETLAWESIEGRAGKGQTPDESADNPDFLVAENRKKSILYIPGLNYCAAPRFKEYSQHAGLVVQKTEPETLIISLQNGFFGKLQRSSLETGDPTTSTLEQLNVGDPVDVEVARITHYKSDGAYAVSLVRKDLADFFWQLAEKKYPLGCQVEGLIAGVNGPDYIVNIKDNIFGFVPKKRLNWWLKHHQASTETLFGTHVEFSICGHRKDKRRMLLDLPNYEDEYRTTIAEKIHVGQLAEGVVTFTNETHAILSLDGGFDALLRKVNCWGLPFPLSRERIVVQVLVVASIDDQILVGLPSPKGLEKPFFSLPLTDKCWECFTQNHFVGETVKVQIVDSVSIGFLASLIDGTTGLLSHTKMYLADKHALAIGDFIEVQIIKIDIGRKKVFFATKHPLDDPDIRVSINEKYTGTVYKTVDYGYFVRLPNGIEGLLHKSNVPTAAVFSVGETIQVYVAEIDLERKRIALSLSQPELAKNCQSRLSMEPKEFP